MILFRYAPDKIIVTLFTSMAAINAIGIQAITDDPVPRPQDIQDLHIGRVAGALEPVSFKDFHVFRLILFALARGKSIRSPPKFKIRLLRS